ncbi:MAG: hypothetical protein JJU12_03805 [Chlamydiales bacterium]|nr:hypothetical protein [Chlamydiales bacterium]
MNKPRKEVQNLILMLSSAVFVAFIAVVALVYYFGSSGTYLLRDLLISPEALKRISFTDYDPETGERSPFVFNNIEFVRAERSGRDWGRYAVSKESYEEFYKLVSQKRSIPQISDEMISQFEIVAPSTLTIFVQARDNKGTREKGFVFQQVEFLDDADLFRVLMRDSPGTWVYFTYPRAYNQVIELFAPS